jgi:hypothetical protein
MMFGLEDGGGCLHPEVNPAMSSTKIEQIFCNRISGKVILVDIIQY